MGSATIQGQLWGAAARDWAELQEPTVRPLWAAMLDAASVSTGTRFLDAGCGSGGACLLAAARGAHVTGLDASDALITIARQRMPGGDFRVGDLQELPYADGLFDAIIAANSVQYAADPSAALRELRRICAANGRVIVATWGAPEDCEQRAIFAAVREVLPAPPLGEGPFALSAPGALERFVEQAGLKIVGSGEVDCPFAYPDLEIAWRAQRSAGPLQGAVHAVGEELLKAAVLNAVAPYRTSTGEVQLANRFRYVMARP